MAEVSPLSTDDGDPTVTSLDPFGAEDADMGCCCPLLVAGASVVVVVVVWNCGGSGDVITCPSEHP